MIVWDTPTLEEFKGNLARSNPEDRLSRLPGAVHLDWAELLDADTKKLEPVPELETLLAAQSITPESVVAIY